MTSKTVTESEKESTALKRRDYSREASQDKEDTVGVASIQDSAFKESPSLWHDYLVIVFRFPDGHRVCRHFVLYPHTDDTDSELDALLDFLDSDTPRLLVGESVPAIKSNGDWELFVPKLANKNRWNWAFSKLASKPDILDGKTRGLVIVSILALSLLALLISIPSALVFSFVAAVLFIIEPHMVGERY